MSYFDGYTSGSASVERLDRFKKELKCKAGYTQRGAACQKISAKKLNQPLLAVPALAGGAALTAAIAIPALFTVNDVRQNISPTPDTEPPRAADLSRDEIYRRYNKFKTGDIIQKTFEIAPNTRVWHYAVYVGKNKKTGDHEVIDVHDKEKLDGKKGRRFYVGRHTAMPQARDPATDSIYVQMPRERLSNERIRNRREILARAEEFANMDEWNYSLGENNCEVFARAVVENRPISLDGESVSTFSRAFSRKTIDNAFKVMNEGRGIEVAELQKRLDKASREYRSKRLKTPFRRMDSESITKSSLLSVNYFDLFIDKGGSSTKNNLFAEESFFSSLGMIAPKQYQLIVERVTSGQPDIYKDYLRVALMRDYLILLTGESMLIKEQAEQIL